MERVQKILSNRGYCSRRKGEELIVEGRVKVNDKVITIGDQATNKDKITVDDQPIDRERRVYLIFNKPPKCVTALRDRQLPTVMEFINIKERVFPIGRLDYDSTGILLLTNDGDFANRVMHPRNEVKKTYQVKLNDSIRKEQIKWLQEGVELRDGTTKPAIIKKIDRTFLEVTISEGKNQIIKRMFRKVGFRVKQLKRISIGRLKLARLKPGEYRELTQKELDKIFVKKRKVIKKDQTNKIKDKLKKVKDKIKRNKLKKKK
jgi:23S rRNA pseudouridine2605 synthase